jgi:hypothetical protein
LRETQNEQLKQLWNRNTSWITLRSPGHATSKWTTSRAK